MRSCVISSISDWTCCWRSCSAGDGSEGEGDVGSEDNEGSDSEDDSSEEVGEGERAGFRAGFRAGSGSGLGASSKESRLLLVILVVNRGKQLLLLLLLDRGLRLSGLRCIPACKDGRRQCLELGASTVKQGVPVLIGMRWTWIEQPARDAKHTSPLEATCAYTLSRRKRDTKLNILPQVQVWELSANHRRTADEQHAHVLERGCRFHTELAPDPGSLELFNLAVKPWPDFREKTRRDWYEVREMVEVVDAEPGSAEEHGRCQAQKVVLGRGRPQAPAHMHIQLLLADERFLCQDSRNRLPREVHDGVQRDLGPVVSRTNLCIVRGCGHRLVHPVCADLKPVGDVPPGVAACVL